MTFDAGSSLFHAAPPPKERRGLGLVLGAISTVLLVAAALSPRWFTNTGSMFGGDANDDVHISLRTLTTCTHDHCLELGNGSYADTVDAIRESHGTSPAFAPCGWITFIGCLVAAFGMAIAVGLALARRHPLWPIAPTTIAFLGAAIALIAGCVFVATKPASADAPVLAWGFWVFGPGVVTALAGSMFLARAIRPIDDEEPAAAAGSSLDRPMNPDDF